MRLSTFGLTNLGDMLTSSDIPATSQSTAIGSAVCCCFPNGPMRAMAVFHMKRSCRTIILRTCWRVRCIRRRTSGILGFFASSELAVSRFARIRNSNLQTWKNVGSSTASWQNASGTRTIFWGRQRRDMRSQWPVAQHNSSTSVVRRLSCTHRAVDGGCRGAVRYTCRARFTTDVSAGPPSERLTG